MGNSMRIRWLKKLSGAIELQYEVKPGPDQVETWLTVPTVTQVSDEEVQENQRIAAKYGISPTQVQRMREEGLISTLAKPSSYPA